MTPDAWLILLATLFTIGGYGLWVADQLPRLRTVFTVLAVVLFVLALVFHDIITNKALLTGCGRPAAGPFPV